MRTINKINKNKLTPNDAALLSDMFPDLNRPIKNPVNFNLRAAKTTACTKVTRIER